MIKVEHRSYIAHTQHTSYLTLTRERCVPVPSLHDDVMV